MELMEDIFLQISLHNFFDVGYWWPIMNQDVHEYCKTCDQCQQIHNMLIQNLVKLVTNLHEKPFQN